jgi:hypothetical protein
MKGIVYIIRADESNRFQIGHTTNDVRTRLSTLQSGSPVKLTIHHTIESFFPSELERALYHILEPYRLDDEWFEIEPESLDNVVGSCSLTEENGVFNLVPSGPNGVKIVLVAYSQDRDDVVVSPECVTLSELESAVYPMIRSLLNLVATVRETYEDGGLLQSGRL